MKRACGGLGERPRGPVAEGVRVFIGGRKWEVEGGGQGALGVTAGGGAGGEG